MADVQIGNANISHIQLTETTTPATGLSTKWRLYVKTDGLYIKSDSGVEYFVGGGPFTAIDINGGAIDGTPIGASSPSSGIFTTVTAANNQMEIRGAAATQRSLYYTTSGTLRWQLYCTQTAESGANAGSDLQLFRYEDAGSGLGAAMTFTRSSGNVNFAGTMSKGGGSFLIDHPLDPANRNLIHSFVEGPRADLIYRGKVRLVRGVATVNIDEASNMTPGTFEALTKHTDADIFLQNTSGWEAVRGQLVGGVLTITTQNQRIGDNDTISWMVVAERNDAFYQHCEMTDEQGQFIVEQDKPTPSAAELAELQPLEVDGIATITQAIVPSLVGKRGYPMHARLTGLVQPMRELRPRPAREEPDRKQLIE